MNYQETVDWLFKQFPSYQVIGSEAYKPTLDNVSEILQSIGNPQDDLTCVHVAGSNGKGSVCSYLSSTLTESGKTVGLFTSPHIKDFSERIRINGQPIDQQTVIDFVQKIQKQNFKFSPSFFEVTFALALWYFKKSNCDICIIETGLGGRLDATNVISPILSVITSISLEHTEILGDTIELIAAEKAGIIKQDVSLVLGSLEKEAQNVIINTANKRNAKVTIVNSRSIDRELTKLFLAEYQIENLKIAKASLDQLSHIGYVTTDEHLKAGITNIVLNTGYRARLQIINQRPLTILDVSHNPAGFETTLDAIHKVNKGKLHIILGSSSDKDISAILNTLPENALYYVTEFTNMRSAKLFQLRHSFGQTNLKSIRYFKEPEKAFELANYSASEEDTILVIGSFFLLEHFF